MHFWGLELQNSSAYLSNKAACEAERLFLEVWKTWRSFQK